MPIPMPPHAGQPQVPPLAGTQPSSSLFYQGPGALAEAAINQQAEIEAAQLALPRLRKLVVEHPDWMDDLDALDRAGNLQGLADLLKRAPSEFAAGMAFGMLATRAQQRMGASAPSSQSRGVMNGVQNSQP